MGVVAAQAAWLLFVVFSLTSPRAPGDESNDGSNAKGARGSGRSKWRRGRRRCLLATARHWGAGAEDGEERRCGAAGDHGGAAPLLERYGGVTCTTLMRESGHPSVVSRFDSPRTYTKSASWDEERRLRVTKAAAAAAAEAAVAEDHEGSARSGLARRKMEKTAAAAATKSLRLEARGL